MLILFFSCQRRKAGHVGAVGIWPFSVFLNRRAAVVRAEPNTYVTLETLALRKPAKSSSDDGTDFAPQENLYCPMDGANQHHQHSVYLPMGSASNLPGHLNTTNEDTLMDSTTLGYELTPQLSDLYLEPGTIVKRGNGDEVIEYEIPQPKDTYLKPRTMIKNVNGNELMGYDIPQPQPMLWEPRATRMTASKRSTYAEQKNCVQRENTYETIECSEPKLVIENGIPETQNEEMQHTYASAKKWETEGPIPDHLYSELSEADMQSGHIYEVLDDFKTQFSLVGSPGHKKV